MRLSLFAIVIASAVSAPAYACRMYSPLELDDVKYADAVVIGRIANYHIVRDQEFRRKMLASPFLSAEDKKFYADPTKGLMSDYARFDVIVSQTLSGRVPKRFSVTWDNSTFGEAASLPTGQYLLALRKPGGRIPPLRGPSATILPDRKDGTMTILQSPCSSAFLFEVGSRETQAIRAKLKRAR